VIPVSPGQPDKQKELSLKADWKYICLSSYKFKAAFGAVAKPARKRMDVSIPIKYLPSIFQPPRA
jgi:hypothetical protein